MTLTQHEREKYDTLLNAVPQYGEFSPAEHYLPVFLDLVGDQRGTVLDAGCCTGKGGVVLAAHGFDVTLCDLTDVGLVPEAMTLPFVQTSLWQDLRLVARGKGHPSRTSFDYVVCCDVLEHIPTHFTMLVIAQLLRVTRRGLFLTISLLPDAFGVWAGTTLHQTVQPYVWWREAIGEIGRLKESRDLLTTGLFWVAPQ
jgi:2-polyprenyl-3-methyl-5-hydroxy-6-metoxy-1,4-benzoquinol methylase